jgi:hypothetical protein
MRANDEQSIFEIIQHVTTRRACNACGRVGRDATLRNGTAAQA